MPDNLQVVDERLKNQEKELDSLKIMVTECVKRIDRNDNNFTRLETLFDVYTKMQKEQIDDIKKEQKDNYDKLEKKMDNLIELITKKMNVPQPIQHKSEDSFKKFGFDIFKEIFKYVIYVGLTLGILNGFKLLK